MEELQVVIEKFIDLSINYGIAQEDGNANKVNKYVRKIEKL